MLDSEALDALAILSPPGTHLEYLWRALRHGLAVLCEKPLVWGMNAIDEVAAEVVDDFVERGILLYENCQWPLTLPAFERLHPGALAAPPRSFRMELQPVGSGVQALGDALSHPLSVLQALLPGEAPAISRITFSPPRSRGEVKPLTIRFYYESGDGGGCETELVLGDDDALPRRAALAIDGREARRVVEPETYRLSFAASHGSVPLDDPLTTLVADFVGCLRDPDEAGREARARDIEQRMRLLAELVHAYVYEETP
jgi:predicted dehydrogenase